MPLTGVFGSASHGACHAGEARLDWPRDPPAAVTCRALGRSTSAIAFTSVVTKKKMLSMKTRSIMAVMSTRVSSRSAGRVASPPPMSPSLM